MKKTNLFNLLKSISRVREIRRCIKLSPQWQTLTLAYLGLKPLTYPFIFKTYKNQKIILHTFNDLVTTWIIFFREEFKVPTEARVVVDAGANIGVFSIYSAQKNTKKIYAIEPYPETFSLLAKNIALNHLEKKVVLNPVALSGKSENQNLKVPTLTLEEFFKSISVDKIDLLKIDIESDKHDVFYNSSDETLQKIQSIALGYHPNGSKKELFNRLIKANFKLTFDRQISEQSGVAYFSKH